ncbi:hypothetical protein QFC19_004757 [Naganishia cerealis]|uniref:Uncharacterized protein n=1 Tax=Naganishia cerealis TaxID=610337 RepID=A0ACC2VU44_9TREE|nr:hypothetical protein QFC19_004757 [Naganishia cerealis]
MDSVMDTPMMELELSARPEALLPHERMSVEDRPRRQSSTPSLANRVHPPQSEDEWVEFIDNYIRYGFVTQSELFLPADNQIKEHSPTTSGDVTPMQETFEFTMQTEANIENAVPAAMDISPKALNAGTAPMGLPTIRRPSSSKGDSDDCTKQCHTMSSCSTGSMSGSGAFSESRRSEAQRVKKFYEQNGFLCAPAQLPRDAKKRLRAIRRLGFDGKDLSAMRRPTLDRYTKLLTLILKAKMSTVTILGSETQVFPSEVGLGINRLGMDLGICTHTALSTGKPLVIENADNDWRFSKHPMVLSGTIKSYCGAPLRQGKSAAIIGTLCVIDDKPRPDFNSDVQEMVKELAACVSNELELLAKAEEQKLAQRMHNVASRFSQQWLQSTSSLTRTINRQKANGRAHKGKKQVNIAMSESEREPDEQISIYDEACQYVSETIKRAIPPIPQSKEQPHSGRQNGFWQTDGPESFSSGSAGGIVSSPVEEAPEGDFSAQEDIPMETLKPQVYHVPIRSSSTGNLSLKDGDMARAGILGCSDKDFSPPQNMSQILMTTIVHNLQSRKIWYEAGDGDVDVDGDGDSEEADIKLLLGKDSAALVLPVFDHRGQIPFLFVACSSDDIFAYDAAALSFITMDESQRAFATMANHELKTPLHRKSFVLIDKILMCAHDLRETLEIGLDESRTPTMSEKTEMFKLCDIILAGAEKTQGILTAVVEYHANADRSTERQFALQMRTADDSEEVEDILTEALHDAVEQEKLKKAALGQDLSLVETIVEIVPRKTGWKIARDSGTIKKVLEYLLVNAYHATTEGYILITCEDTSQQGNLTTGYDDATATVRIRVKDTGCGMPKEFHESGEIFDPFTKVDKFSSGAGLGVTLAKRTIDAMGGSIYYESLPGKGTLVTIEVPLPIEPGQDAVNNASSKVKLTRIRCALLGFQDSSQFGIHVVGDFLKRKLERRNVEICEPEEADIIIIEERALNEESVKIDMIPEGNNPSENTPVTEAATDAGEALAVSPIQEVMATALEADLHAIKQCIPASELKVLIVEDNAINRQVLARMIKKLGYPYEEAEDGVVGVEKYKTFRPSLVLMDIDMPRKDGFGASADIRAYEAKLHIPKAPIVAVTAIRDDAAIARGKIECKIDHWLVKPLGLKLLTEKITELYDIQR